MTATAENKLVAHCLGRFDFLLPPILRIESREQRIYLLKAWTEMHSNMEVGWSTAFAAIDKGTDRRARTSAASEFTLQGVGSAVWYSPSSYHPDDRKLLAMRAINGIQLFLEASATKGRESIAEDVVRRVAVTFLPQSDRGFCLGFGALSIAPSKNERVIANFVGSGVELTVSTETTVTAKDDGDEGMEDHPDIKITMTKARVVGGFAGTERHAYLSVDDPPQWVYSWTFEGRLGDALAPRIELTASSTQNELSNLRAIWTPLLESFRMRPVGPS